MVKIFFDMDGTIAKFYIDKKWACHMHRQNYFENLPPYAMVDTVKKLVQNGYDVYILSACVDTAYCATEKIAWLKKHLPEIKTEKILLCKVGENKGEILRQKIGIDKNTKYVLVDDYSKNLFDWANFGQNFVGIKYCNGLNNKTKKEYKIKVKNGVQLEKVLEKLA